MGRSPQGDAPIAADGPSGDDSAADAWGDLNSPSVRFRGRTGEFYRIWLANLALVVATCGLYAPWARVRSRQYFLGQTQLQG
ncbi:MAG: DUF898 family protein, partial [Cyanobium sp.]